MFKLVICDDEGKTTIVPLIRDEVLIGRREGNTIRLTDRNVSRRHARIVRKDDNTFSVEDLGSCNGTKVNGEPAVDGPLLVTPGDQVYIGDYNLSVRTDVSAGVPMGKQMDAGDNAGIGKVTTHARLVLLTGKDTGKEFDLTVNLYVVGRSEEANLRVDDPSISRAHARLDGDEHQWTISDLDSINGIMVNGQKRDDYLLKSGDVIELGMVKFRFVPPGEPFEYSPETDVLVAPAPKKINKFLIILAAVAAVAILAILLVILGPFGGSDDGNNGVGEGSNEAEIEQLIEKGKDHIQAEEWDDAARLFAEAQRLAPTRKNIRELKNNAIAEMEAQDYYLAALEAEKNKDWQKAVSSLSNIKRSSHYYDLEMMQGMSGKLCEELLDKADFMAESGNREGALQTLEEIKDLREAPDSCEEGLAAFEKRHGKKGSDQGTVGSTSPAFSQNKPAKVKLSPNPYGSGNPYENPYEKGENASEPKPQPAPAANPTPMPVESADPSQFGDSEKPPSSGNKGSSSITWDPVGEARSELNKGNVGAAIKILEKGGNSVPVLSFLANLYKKQGQKDKYETTARKFIKLYPNHNKSEKYKQDLGM